MSAANVKSKEAAKSAVDAIDPNSFQALSIRRWITLSYWTIILLCVPYWWYSTTIERHALPLDRIEQWQNRGPCPVQVPVSMSVSPAQNSQASNIIDRINEISSSAERCIVFNTQASPLGYQVTLHLATESTAQLLGERSIDIGYKDENDAVAKLANLFMPSPEQNGLAISKFTETSKVIKYAEKYKLVFSLLNEDASKGGISQWDTTSALERHIYPLLRALKGLHKYDLETQVQYYAPLVVEREITDQGTFIAEDQLKVFVNSAEWNLAVSSDPVLHFVLYVPATDKRPLFLKRSDGSAEPLTFFSIPQWGGVVIYNSEQPHESGVNVSDDLAYEQLETPFAKFASLLRISHGIPTIGTVTGSSPDKASWEIQALMRERIVQNVRDTVQKLGAIARQANEIQNMRIPKAVQEDVNAALDALALVESEDLQDAMRQSATASTLATRASFNHEMLAMLYFPDEHKWAVYTPLFGPIAVPLLVALIREVKEYKKRRREKLKKE